MSTHHTGDPKQPGVGEDTYTDNWRGITHWTMSSRTAPAK